MALLTCCVTLCRVTPPGELVFVTMSAYLEVGFVFFFFRKGSLFSRRLLEIPYFLSMFTALKFTIS